jgi:hypothetical protein
MRIVATALITALVTAVLSVGLTVHHMNSEVFRVKVDSFNDGFKTGACQNGEDGFGHVCQEG